MNETEFWGILEALDWSREGCDEEVLEPAVKLLSERTDEEIFAFEDTLSKLLYNLDSMELAVRMYGSADGISADDFLYARCVALINGKAYYDAVLSGEGELDPDMEFESILYVPAEAWSRKHRKSMEDYPHNPAFSYESGSNTDQWPQPQEEALPMKIPTYYEGFVKDYTENGFSRVVLCSSSGNDLLEVWYAGELPETGGEMEPIDPEAGIAEEVPVIIVAKDPKTGEEILVFDEARHGYDGMFCNEYPPELLENRTLKRLDLPASTLVVEMGYGIPYEDEKDEYEIDGDGNVALSSGSKMSWEEVKRNGIDYLALYYVGSGGDEVLITEFELA